MGRTNECLGHSCANLEISLQEPQCFAGFTAQVVSAFFSPDNDTLVTGGVKCLQLVSVEGICVGYDLVSDHRECYIYLGGSTSIPTHVPTSPGFPCLGVSVLLNVLTSVVKSGAICTYMLLF